MRKHSTTIKYLHFEDFYNKIGQQLQHAFTVKVDEIKNFTARIK